MNAFSAVFSFITLVHQEELYNSLYFVYEHPHMIVHLSIFCICSTVGQLFIFYTIKTIKNNGFNPKGIGSNKGVL
jgi:adenosine 3'-phospho 5'-phosphosulfate transporter B2